MAKREPAVRRSKGGVKIKVGFESVPDSEVEVVAYAFDQRGRFLESAPLVKGSVQLQLDVKQAPHARIYLGPPVSERVVDEVPTLKMMERIRAYEPVWKYNAKAAVQELLPIPDGLCVQWRWCSCRVRGRVVKPVEFGDTTEDMPVCHARVHICEVDPLSYIIARLPDDTIMRLRDEWFKEFERPPFRFPRPLPDPPPFKYNPGVIDPSPEAIAEMNRVRLTSEELISESTGSSLTHKMAPNFTELAHPRSLEYTALGPQPEPPDMPQGTELINLNLDDKVALMSSSSTVVRQALLDNRALIYPYICYWPWFWPYLKCDEMAVLETDSNGRFDTAIWYLCIGDHPDLYFWVEYCIGGVWTPVYKPPRPCLVHWNYSCGSEVTLRVTDPRVPWCGDPVSLPGLQVVVATIGNNINVSRIQDYTAGVNEGLTSDGRPFGGILEPHVWFGEDLAAAGIGHYRWSYKRLTEGDGITSVTDGWHVMDRHVVRHYAVIDPTPPDYPLTYKPYVLGPEQVVSTDNLFQINPDLPADGSGWAPMLDARENSASAFFLSHQLEGGDALAAAGKYELKLELFDTGGNRVNLDAAGVLLKVPQADKEADFGPEEVETKLAEDRNRIKDADGNTVAFKLVLRVDNNPCEAEIYTISGPDLTVNSNCGFVQYIPGANAHVSFMAKHPNGFADFRFHIHRGTGHNVSEAQATGLVSNTTINGYDRNSDYVYSKEDIPVYTLLTSNTPPNSIKCDKAAFAETLDVDALATDGWSGHLWYLDVTATPVAFALEPEVVVGSD